MASESNFHLANPPNSTPLRESFAPGNQALYSKRTWTFLPDFGDLEATNRFRLTHLDPLKSCP